MKFKGLSARRVSCALSLALAAAAVVSAPAHADVKASAPDGMILQFKGEVALPRDAAWSRLLDPAKWWSDAHTYSGSAASLYVDAVAGGCWCELWEGGEVEHGRVVYVAQNKTIRFDASLGPLQDLGVKAALTFTLANGSDEGKTAVTVDMKVTGSSLSGLDKLAPVVDQVLAEQVKRFLKP
jgi:hypothetical protein